MAKYTVITREATAKHIWDIEADECNWESPTAKRGTQTVTTQQLLLVFRRGKERVAEFNADQLVGWRLSPSA